MDVTWFIPLTEAQEILDGTAGRHHAFKRPGRSEGMRKHHQGKSEAVRYGYPDFCHLSRTSADGSGYRADTHKMKYYHRGGNHPVRDLMGDGRVYITSQNHGYVVDVDSVDKSVAVPAFENVNDGTNEGLYLYRKEHFTVQFHPEACPGPHDSISFLTASLAMVKGAKNA